MGAQTKHKLTLTERTLIARLTENTGIHMLDSGGASGRHWQQNRGRDFMAEPATTLDFSYGSISVTHNVFHWLKDRITYDWFLQGQFTRFANSPEQADECWLANMEAFAKMRVKRSGYSRECIYTVNTYNGEDALSQILQYVGWQDDDGEHLLIQVHGGADARGGYGTPLATSDFESIYCNADSNIYCQSCGSNWYSDDNYHFYPGEVGVLDIPDLTAEHPQLFDVERSVPERPLKQLQDYQIINDDEFPEEREPDIIYANSEGQGLCPYCSKGVLIASA